MLISLDRMVFNLFSRCRCAHFGRCLECFFGGLSLIAGCPFVSVHACLAYAHIHNASNLDLLTFPCALLCRNVLCARTRKQVT